MWESSLKAVRYRYAILGVSLLGTFMIQGRSVTITIFIHGTICSELCIFDLRKTYTDNLTDTCTYIKLLNRVRKNPLMYVDQPMLEEGLTLIDPAIIRAIQNRQQAVYDRARAVYFIIAAYDRIAQTIKPDEEKYYYTFGYLGALSQKYRDSAAQQLYDVLVELVAFYKQQYDEVFINLEAHSHGGNVSLKLQEKENIHKKNLVINCLTMWGTPIQQETAALACGTVFKTVINCYGEFDNVQTIDTLSTEGRKSYRSIQEYNSHLKTKDSIHDVRLVINRNEYSVGHLNMWFLTHSYSLAAEIDPLPLLVLSPCITQLVRESRIQHADFYVLSICQSVRCQMGLYKGYTVAAQTANVLPQLQELRNSISSYWVPHNALFHRSWSRKEAYAIWQALRNK